jgi:hypothetical protein
MRADSQNQWVNEMKGGMTVYKQNEMYRNDVAANQMKGFVKSSKIDLGELSEEMK